MTSWIGAAGSVLFVLVLLVEGWRRPGYSPVRHPVSALALGERGWVQTASFVLSGVAIIFGAVGIALQGPSALLGATVAVFGLGLLASGVFTMDPMRGYPPGTPQGDPSDVSKAHTLHDHAGAVVFFSLPVVAVVAAFVLPGAWTIVSAVAATGLTIAALAFGVAWENDSARTGLVQRAFIVPGWLWLAAVFVDLASN